MNFNFKILSTVVFLLFFSVKVSAQEQLYTGRTVSEMDSLKGLININHEKQEISEQSVDTIIEYVYAYYRSDIDACIAYMLKTREMSENLNYDFGVAKSAQLLGFFKILSNDLSESIAFTEYSIIIFEKLENQIELNNSRSNLAFAYMEKEEFDSAIKIYTKYLPEMYKSNDIFNINRSTVNIAIIYRELELYDRAIKNLKNSITALTAQPRSTNRKAALSYIYFELSKTYLNFNQIDSAYYYNSEAKELREESNERLWLIDSYTIEGDIYRVRNEYGNALDAYKKAEELLTDEEKENERYLLLQLGLASLYLEQNILSESKEYLHKAVEQKNLAIYPSLQLRALKLKAKLGKQNKNYSSASSFYEEYIFLKDSLNSAIISQQLGVLYAEFQVTKQEQEIEILEQNQELNQARISKANLLKNSSIVGTFFLLIILGLVGYQYHLKRNSERTLKDKNEHLLKLSEEKNTFMRMAAHDLKNPLSSITGIVSLVELKTDNDELLDFMHMINKVTTQMLEVIKNLLNVEAIESGEEIIQVKPINLTPFLSKVVDTYKIKAEEKNIKIDYNFESSELMVLADKSAINGIFENLVSNAIKYSPKNKSIWINAFEKQDIVVVEIKDEGPGFSKQDKEYIFQKFKTLSAQPTGGEHSNGLGLYIVKNMVEKLNAKIECVSKKGSGATFLVELPRQF